MIGNQSTIELPVYREGKSLYTSIPLSDDIIDQQFHLKMFLSSSATLRGDKKIVWLAKSSGEDVSNLLYVSELFTIRESHFLPDAPALILKFTKTYTLVDKTPEDQIPEDSPEYEDGTVVPEDGTNNDQSIQDDTPQAPEQPSNPDDYLTSSSNEPSSGDAIADNGRIPTTPNGGIQQGGQGNGEAPRPRYPRGPFRNTGQGQTDDGPGQGDGEGQDPNQEDGEEPEDQAPEAEDQTPEAEENPDPDAMEENPEPQPEEEEEEPQPEEAAEPAAPPIPQDAEGATADA